MEGPGLFGPVACRHLKTTQTLRVGAEQEVEVGGGGEGEGGRVEGKEVGEEGEVREETGSGGRGTIPET